MAELRERLQTALGAGYRIEKELGGGGMSHVFLAEEVRLGRRVVVKVLPPEMSMGVSVDRFEREIQLAAKLQHPHIVPLLSAGSSDDLLYYIMPYIEGESLRAKLAREGELPVAETLRILRDVLDALAYAHGQHVVHRDIKPDNVLLSGKHALVTDFGVAKAVAESTGRHTITSMGVALGTPLYMAPEQAAADPHIDHRADVYALGAMAYEMLCGRPPFAGVSPQAVLAAHLTDAPEPVTRHRTAVPEALNAVILRCLEKKPADRWQRAEELLPHLEAMLTPTGGTTPVGTQPVLSSGTQAAIDRAHPVRVAALFGLASIGVLAIVYALVQVVGLPDWVYYGAVALLAAGLPIMLLTGHHERERARRRSSGQFTAPGGGGMERHFTWRKALLGGGLAFAGLGVITTGYMAMRVLGIGPVGTLLASGVLRERDGIILADFVNRTGDTTLGPSATELFRVGISQSPLVNVLDRSRINEVLQRMQRPASTPIDRDLAREMAEREGLKAIITGELAPVGTGYAITAQLISTSGELLTAQQASAASAGEIVAAVGDLAGKIRERIGESLRAIRRAAPLDQVTTASLPALRLYTQGLAAENTGDLERAVELLQQAVDQDSSFAMAYRKLGTILGNSREQRERATRAITKAFEHRDRLTEKERAHAAGIYYTRVTGEREKAIAAYQTLLERYPGDHIALNNTGVLYTQLHDFDRALEYHQRALGVDSSVALYYSNVVFVQTIKGDFDAADRTLARLDARFPGHPRVAAYGAPVAYGRGDFARAAALVAQLRRVQSGDLYWQAWASQRLAELAAVQGRVAEARTHWQDARAATERRGLKGEYLNLEGQEAMADLLLREDPSGARKRLEAALRRTPVEGLAVMDRPYLQLVLFYAWLGDAPAARRWADAFRASGRPQAGRDAEVEYRLADASAALAAGSGEAVIADARDAAESYPCVPCVLPVLSRGYDAAGNADSVIALWERYLSWHWRLTEVDFAQLPTAYRRLGELYEAKGNREKALDYYGKFAELWKAADPELQSAVRDVKQRMARLAGEGGPR